MLHISSIVYHLIRMSDILPPYLRTIIQKQKQRDYCNDLAYLWIKRQIVQQFNENNQNSFVVTTIKKEYLACLQNYFTQKGHNVNMEYEDFGINGAYHTMHISPKK